MNHREYSKHWMREKRAPLQEKNRKKRLTTEGRCTECEVLLIESPNHDCLRKWKIIT